MATPAGVEDLLGDAAEDVDSYFDPGEFAERVRLEEEHFWHVYRRDVLLDALRRATPDGSGRLLEIGCGVGTVATHLNDNGFTVDYADVHSRALELARERARARLGATVDARRFLRLDVCKHDPPSGYDGVLMFDVLEHLPDDETVAKRVRRALDGASGRGVFVFTVPAFQQLWSPWDDVQKHKRRYTKTAARALAERAGFTVERLTYFFAPLFVAAVGVKCVRAARDRVLGPPPPTEFSSLLEARSLPALNQAMLAILSVEWRWLSARELPFGTSLLCVARPR